MKIIDSITLQYRGIMNSAKPRFPRLVQDIIDWYRLMSMVRVLNKDYGYNVIVNTLGGNPEFSWITWVKRCRIICILNSGFDHYPQKGTFLSSNKPNFDIPKKYHYSSGYRNPNGYKD